jgi:hypothetical protein
VKRLRNFVDHRPLSAFLLLAFGIAWTLWIPGILVSHGRIVSFGIFGICSPALAGMIISHRGKRVEQAAKVRLVVVAAALLIAVASMLSASFFPATYSIVLTNARLRLPGTFNRCLDRLRSGLT